MHIKFHPATIVEISDDRIDIFFGTPVFPLDKFKIKLIKNVIQKNKKKLIQRPFGEYRFYLREYNLVNREVRFVLMKK